MFVTFTGTPLDPEWSTSWMIWYVISVQELMLFVRMDISINMRPSCGLKLDFSSLSSSAQQAISKLPVSETFDLGRPFFHHFRYINIF